ncbi:hypothetical protein MNBD_BACTEROID03-1874 [hydrothermal vent metagenome]|uniref:Uncharacterized protein n=1 Tax=hydrothermal vent metagenome TaxID=652676 RepID=A0A3B0TTI2_9ZZZZ
MTRMVVTFFTKKLSSFLNVRSLGSITCPGSLGIISAYNLQNADLKSTPFEMSTNVLPLE